MPQIMLDNPQYCPWLLTHKGDRACRQLADRHYSRQHVGASMFSRPGRNLVLMTAGDDAVLVTWSGIRVDGQRAWEYSIFCKESTFLRNDLHRGRRNYC
jgi:hypothetical protein